MIGADAEEQGAQRCKIAELMMLKTVQMFKCGVTNVELAIYVLMIQRALNDWCISV